jgi:hypothetical protein
MQPSKSKLAARMADDFIARGNDSDTRKQQPPGGTK